MTERFRFTHDKITRVAPRDQRFIVWDSTHRGLGLRVTPRGTRSFIVAYRFNGYPRMLTIGNSPPLTLEQALERYSDALKSVAQARQMRVQEHETPPAELRPARRKRDRREARNGPIAVCRADFAERLRAVTRRQITESGRPPAPAPMVEW